MVDINQWQRLIVAGSIDQNGFPQNPLQGIPWRPMALGPFLLPRSRTDEKKPWIDPGPPPFWARPPTRSSNRTSSPSSRASSELTTEDGVSVDISPATIGDNALGTNDGHGYATNPFTGQPYVPNPTLRRDFYPGVNGILGGRPSSETPGHWNSIANHVSDDMTSFRIGGTGLRSRPVEWDVAVFTPQRGGV